MIIDTYGATAAELNTITAEAARLADLGYTVPDITIKFISAPANGIAGNDTIYIHPNRNLEELRFTIAHEIGHHNAPKFEINIWDETTWNTDQKHEDFANWFAETI